MSALASPPAPVLLSTEPVISVRNVSKMYMLYDRPEDRLKQALFWRFGRQFGRPFWALRDVSLEVRRGESIGILGRNGSGKSTLLQIIAGTLQATSGDVETHGRIAALLELGSGFNPEYTGRENVFMNGSILGLSREAMESRFDAIAAFADIGEFLDQPIKIYSSGMIVRLAFAVQAHIDPDVLIVDEALAVGDVYFQHKCMRHIKSLLDRGTTLLLVSHATDTVKRFCSSGLWLDSGSVQYFGESGVAAEKYLAHMRMAEAQLAATEGMTDSLAADPLSPDDRSAASNSEGSAVAQEIVNLLVRKSGAVDLSDRSVLFRGQWEVTHSALGDHVPPLSVVSAASADCSAGFRFGGSQLSVDCITGPKSGRMSVVIDGSSRELDLFQPGRMEIRRIQFDLAEGEHWVVISPSQAYRSNSRLSLVTAIIDAPSPLEYRRDVRLADLAQTNEVDRYGTFKAVITAVELLDFEALTPIVEAHFGQRVRLRIHAERLKPAGPRLEFAFVVRDKNRIDLFGTTTQDEGIRLDPDATRFVAEFAFDLTMAPGSYSLQAAFVECSEDLSQKAPLDCINLAYVFNLGFDPGRPVWYTYHVPVVARGYVE